MDEVVSEALKHINRKSKEHTIRVTSGKDFILAHIDDEADRSGDYQFGLNNAI